MEQPVFIGANFFRFFIVKIYHIYPFGRTVFYLHFEFQRSIVVVFTIFTSIKLVLGGICELDSVLFNYTANKLILSSNDE